MASPEYPFYFAWVDEADNVFGPQHEVVDESIFSFNIKHDEGQHPTLDITLINPRIGLLHAGRKLWVWFSWHNKETGHIVPLFFGVLVGVPANLFQEKVTLQFIARSPTYIDDKQAVAETMKVRPYYDPVFLDDAHRDEPDAILEGWSKLWHIDRTSLVTTASDILEGEDGTAVFGEGDGFYDSLSLKLGEAPLTDIRVEANVKWTQRQERLMPGPHVTIDTYTGETFMGQWPKSGASLGGGWKVEQSYVIDTFRTAWTPTVSLNNQWESKDKHHNNCDTISMTSASTYPATPIPPVTWPPTPGAISAILTTKFTIGWCDPGDSLSMFGGHDPVNTPSTYASTGLIVPLWNIQAAMELRYQAKRAFTESLSFDVKANTQGVLTSPAVAQHTELITISGADVGEPLIVYDAWSDFQNKPVGITTLIYPNNPTTPGGMSYQVCIQSGVCGSVEPAFSDIPGETIADGSAIWASLGKAPESVIQQTTFATSYGPGTILFYQEQYFDQNTGQLEDVIGRPGFPWDRPPGMMAGHSVQGNTGYYLITSPVSTNSEYTKYIYEPISTTSDQIPPAKILVEVEEFPPVGMFLGVSPLFLGIPIGGSANDVTARCYFPTDRGRWSVEYLICKARARLRMRARAVTVGWDCPFDLAAGLSCRMNATISDPRLPGTTATGKIVNYELSGRDGKFIGHVEIGCAVGYGGHVSADPGTPEYASPGYMQGGYQKYDGALIVVSETDGDINYTPPGFYPFDDGLVFPLTLRQVADNNGNGLISGNLDDQAAAIKSGVGASQLEANETMNGVNLVRQSATGQMSYDWTTYTVQQFATPVSAAWALAESQRALSQWDVPRMMENNPITWTMELKNIQNGPFNGSYALHVSMLEVVQGINLEAPSSL